MDPTPVPDVPNLDWWNQLRKQEQQNAPNKPPAPAPGSPQAMSSALMGGQDPYENMHGTGPQGNVANALLNTGSGALLKAREGISGQNQPSAEDLASGKVPIPSWQSAIPQAINMGMQAGGAGGPEPAIFGGVTAKTANLGALDKAQHLWGRGTSQDSVFGQTGWFKGADGNWRYEIPDQYSFLQKSHPLWWERTGEPTTVGEGFNHQELFKAYPDLKNMELGMLTDGGRGVYNFPPEEYIALDPDRALSHGGTDTMLHELQHAVQQREGFTNGMSPELQYHSPLVKMGAEDNMPISSMQNASEDIYHRGAGEVEARNTAARRFFSPAERKLMPPWKTEDVQRAQQIIGRPTLYDYLTALRKQK